VTQPPPNEPAPEVIDSRHIHDGFLGLRVDRLRFADGRESVQDVIEHPGGITLVAFDPQGRLLLVRQYRHPAGRYLLELPAGTLDPNESPEVCAERELQEETGYKPGRLQKLGGFFLAPGYDAEYQHVYYASELTESKLIGDEETLSVEAHPLDQALEMVSDGRIEDAKTAAALLLYIRFAS
jgi:ADP-ribose pyrophosphatase